MIAVQPVSLRVEGLPVDADAGIAEAAVFGVSPGYFLRQIYPLIWRGEDTTACGWFASLR